MMMGYRYLVFFVEGNDDVRFFEKIVKPKFIDNYDHIKIITYAEEKPKFIIDFIKSLEAMNNKSEMEANYILARDLDANTCLLVTKEKLLEEYSNISLNNVIIVAKQIEGWYLAGLEMKTCKSLHIKFQSCTDNIKKDCFNKIIPKKFYDGPRWVFLNKILELYSINVAVGKNKSFKYFNQKFIEEDYKSLVEF